MIFITISLLLCIISPRHFSAISTSDISFNEKWFLIFMFYPLKYYFRLLLPLFI